MHPSKILIAMTASGASLVSASPATEESDSSISRTVSWPKSKPWWQQTSTPPPSPKTPSKPSAADPFALNTYALTHTNSCPTWKWSGRQLSPAMTENGHCCLPGAKDALNCCHLIDMPRLKGTLELPCISRHWATAANYEDFRACNTWARMPWWCTRNRIPVLPELTNKYSPQVPVNLMPPPKPKTDKAGVPVRDAYAPGTGNWAMAYGLLHPPRRRRPSHIGLPKLGKSRLGEFPNGNPATPKPPQESAWQKLGKYYAYP